MSRVQHNAALCISFNGGTETWVIVATKECYVFPRIDKQVSTNNGEARESALKLFQSRLFCGEGSSGSKPCNNKQSSAISCRSSAFSVCNQLSLAFSFEFLAQQLWFEDNEQPLMVHSGFKHHLLTNLQVAQSLADQCHPQLWNVCCQLKSASPVKCCVQHFWHVDCWQTRCSTSQAPVWCLFLEQIIKLWEPQSFYLVSLQSHS